MPRQLWIADACRDAGLRTLEVQGWRDRGSPGFAPKGCVLHHTAGPATGDMPSLPILVSGRRDLPGPLSQFGLARSGKVYVIASGTANHAGPGGWHGLYGNSAVWGIEAENTGTGQAWPVPQLDAYVRLAAVLAARTPFSAGMVCAHREWSPRRKIDPVGIDMDDFRARVADLLRPAPPTSWKWEAHVPKPSEWTSACHDPVSGGWWGQTAEGGVAGHNGARVKESYKDHPELGGGTRYFVAIVPSTTKPGGFCQMANDGATYDWAAA